MPESIPGDRSGGRIRSIVIFDIAPGRSAGPLHLGLTYDNASAELVLLGTVLVVCGATGSPGLAVERASGLFIDLDFDADKKLREIRFGRPDDRSDSVQYRGLDLFATDVRDVLAFLRTHTPVLADQESDGTAYLARDLHLRFWRPPPPVETGDPEDRTFAAVQVRAPSTSDSTR